MEYHGMKWVLEELRLWVEKFSEWKKTSKKQEEEALSKFLEALNETTIYLGNLENDPLFSNREMEEKLSRLWREAAERVKEYNGELARRCNSKSGYWGKPNEWSSEELTEMNISIRDITNFANRILNGV